jgi:hypothetical protein
MTHPKRPRDPNQLAKSIIDIATGQVAGDEAPESAYTKRARSGGRKGGPARSAALTPEQRAEIARAAAVARWKKRDCRCQRRQGWASGLMGFFVPHQAFVSDRHARRPLRHPRKLAGFSANPPVLCNPRIDHRQKLRERARTLQKEPGEDSSGSEPIGSRWLKKQ